MSRKNKNRNKKAREQKIGQEPTEAKQGNLSTLEMEQEPEIQKVERRAVGKLVFTPYAWAKLLWFRNRGDTEVSGFGISSIDDPLYVTDFMVVPQQCTGVTTEMDDEGVADFFEDMFEAGLQPCEYGRIWIHTHPGMGVEPSGTDHECFNKVFGKCDWSIMMILGGNKGEQKTSCRLKFNTGPGTTVMLPVGVDWNAEFAATNHDAWEKAYLENVTEVSVYSVGTDLAKAGVGYSQTYGGGTQDSDEDVFPTQEIVEKALAGDMNSLVVMTNLDKDEIGVLMSLGFDAEQITWYGNELVMLDGPGDLDEAEELQRVSMGSDPRGCYGGYWY